MTYEATPYTIAYYIAKDWKQIKHGLYRGLVKQSLKGILYSCKKRMRMLSILLGKGHWDVF